MQKSVLGQDTPGIYCWLNTATGERYVGQSVAPEKRRVGHVTTLRRSACTNRHLQTAWSTYGEHAFLFQLLETVTEAELDDAERKWIAYYKSNVRGCGYNNESGGSRRKRHSPETIRRMSQAKLGKRFTPEHCAAMSRANRGRVVTEATKQKISATEKGRVFSAETRRKISEAKRGVSVPLERRLRIAATLTGRKQTAETRKQLAESLPQRKAQWRLACKRKERDECKPGNDDSGSGGDRLDTVAPAEGPAGQAGDVGRDLVEG